jgi:hypothetical protein
VNKSRHVFASLLLAFGLAGTTAFAKPPVIVKLSAKASGWDIQKALDGLPPKGEVVLKAGTYNLSQPLRLRHDYQTLRGSGPATILNLADGANCPVVILGPPLSRDRYPVSHLRLANLRIYGNRSNQKVELWRSARDGDEFNNDGVEVWNVTDAVVEHVISCRCRSGGLVSTKARRLLVNDFESYDNQFDGLACYQTTDSRFEGLRLHDNLAAGISLDLAFNHNLITNAFLAGNDLGIFMRYSKDNAFKDLTILRSRHDGIFMAQVAVYTAKGWQLSPGTECIGNDFENLKVSDCGGKAFRVNDASCTNNVISAARFLRNVQGGMIQPVANTVVLRNVVGY